MNIKNWPRSERPREKLLERGAEFLSDAELLAIIVGTGTRGADAVTTARAILTQVGSLKALFLLEYSNFRDLSGLGPRAFATLHAASEIFRRSLLPDRRTPIVIDNATAAEELFEARLAHLDHESFACLFLDTRHRMIGFEVLATGTLDRAQVYPREIVKRVLERRAAAVIFGHNHPSGIAEPSAADRSLTKQLKSALALIDVRVLDHIVVATGHTVSMANLGLLDP